MKKHLLLLVMILLPLVASAHDIEVQNADGVTIYYNYINDGKELEVTFRGDNYSYYDEYKGNIIIPEEVTYMNRTRKVTSIGYGAFASSYSLTSVTIPNSVTSIDEYAFAYCPGLTSVTIPNSVTSIGAWAFRECSGLQKVIVSDISAWCDIKFGDNHSFDYSNPLHFANHLYSDENTEIKDLVIPNSVTSIGGFGAFAHCYSLTSVTIPNSVTSIGQAAFERCSGLTSVTIPNSVTSIGDNAFSDCSGLTSVTIPNSVTSIGGFTFSGCSSLTSVTIPNSVTSIGFAAFRDCSGLTSVTIPNSVTSIGDNAFDGWDLPVVISLIENPFIIDGKTKYARTFSQNTFNNATLYVPKGTIDKYKATDGWKDFLFIEEGVPSGINAVKNTESSNTIIYNLNGVRQSEPKKGINIINGKKVVIK